MITAIVLVHTAADRIPETAQAIADLDGVAEVYSCAGDVDLIAMVKVAEHEQLADVIAGRLSKVDGRAAHRHPHRVPLLQPRGHRGRVLGRPRTDRRLAGRPAQRSGRAAGVGAPRPSAPAARAAAPESTAAAARSSAAGERAGQLVPAARRTPPARRPR